MALLGIASGALKIGQKIFAGIKNRKEKKAEKKAAQAAQAKARAESVAFKIDSLQGLISPDAGSQSISGAGNLLANIKAQLGGSVNPANPSQAVQAQNAALASGGGFNPMYVMIGFGALLILFLLKKR